MRDAVSAWLSREKIGNAGRLHTAIPEQLFAVRIALDHTPGRSDRIAVDPHQLERQRIEQQHVQIVTDHRDGRDRRAPDPWGSR